MQTIHYLIATGIGTGLFLSPLEAAIAYGRSETIAQAPEHSPPLEAAIAYGRSETIAQAPEHSPPLELAPEAQPPLHFPSLPEFNPELAAEHSSIGDRSILIQAQAVPAAPPRLEVPVTPAPGTGPTELPPPPAAPAATSPAPPIPTPILFPEPVPSRPVSTSAADLIPLNPNPDLLQLPTAPAAVTIELNQPITLQQALELARRNNRELQVAELELRQSRAVLRQSRAQEFPTLTFQADIIRAENATLALNVPQIPLQIGLQLQIQQQTEAELLNQLAEAEQELSSQLQELQLRLQQDQLIVQQDEFNQQLQELELATAATAILPPVPQFVPLGPLNLPLQLNQGQVDDDDDPSNIFTASLALFYNLYTAGRRPASIRIAQEQVRLAELEVERQTNDLRLDVANDYYNIQQSAALIRVTQAAVENAQANLRDAEAQERAGLGTRFDVLRAQVQLANTMQDLTQAQNVFRISRRQLAQRLSLEDAATITAAESVAVAGGWPLSLEQSIVLALQNRAELEQILAQRTVAQQQRRLDLADLAPLVTAFANLNVADRLEDDRLGALGYSVGIQLTWLLFDGRDARARAAQQEAAVATAETLFADTRELIRFQVEQAYFSVQANLQNIQTSAIAVDQAQESLRLARLRFQAGVGTQVEVTTALADLTQAQGNLVAAILDYNRSLAALERAVDYAQTAVAPPPVVTGTGTPTSPGSNNAP